MRRANGFQSLSAKENRVTLYGCAHSFSHVFHVFPESPLLYMNVWLGTTFSGDHWQARTEE